jgi:hypothetical protein
MIILQPIEGLRIVRPPINAPKAPITAATFQNLIDSSLNPQVIDAVREVTKNLQAAGIRHAVLGAIAIGVYGWPRATKDVDVLLGDEAWHKQSTGALIPRIDLPEKVLGVGIDYFPLDVAGPFLEMGVAAPFWTDGVPIAPPEVVVCTKLIRLAMRDGADIVEILKAGLIDRAPILAYLVEHTPMLVRRWNELCDQADREIARGV